MEITTRVNIHDITPKGQFTQWGNRENLENALPERCKQYAKENGKEIRSIDIVYSGSAGLFRADGYIVLVTTED